MLWRNMLLALGITVAVGFHACLFAPLTRADGIAYLVNVTVAPGYHFANANQALSYGNEICARVQQGRGYADLVTSVKDDIATSDRYQAAYLIAQAVNELCPERIWQLRNSAAHYRDALP